jgi:hypothetical protein
VAEISPQRVDQRIHVQPEADATWAAFRGDFGTSARIDLLLRDADAQWPGAFGARSVYDLAAVAQDEAFGAAWVPLDDVDAEELWRRVVAAPLPNSAADALAQVAQAWGISLPAMNAGAIGASDRLLVVGPRRSRPPSRPSRWAAIWTGTSRRFVRSTRSTARPSSLATGAPISWW